MLKRFYNVVPLVLTHSHFRTHREGVWMGEERSEKDLLAVCDGNDDGGAGKCFMRSLSILKWIQRESRKRIT